MNNEDDEVRWVPVREIYEAVCHFPVEEERIYSVRKRSTVPCGQPGTSAVLQLSQAHGLVYHYRCAEHAGLADNGSQTEIAETVPRRK